MTRISPTFCSQHFSFTVDCELVNKLTIEPRLLLGSRLLKYLDLLAGAGVRSFQFHQAIDHSILH